MSDPYLYPGSFILKNKFDIKDSNLLEKLEKEATTISINRIRKNPIKGNFNFEHLKKVHFEMFKRVYEWAGEQRTINISKSESVLNGMMFEYSRCDNIQNEVKENLSKLNSIEWKNISLEDRVDNLSQIITNVWKAHPFREGNTRTTIIFFSQFAKEKGFKLNEKLLIDNIAYFRNSLVAASFEDKELGVSRNYRHLNRILKDSMKSNVKQQEKGL
ncbi:MAG: Fic family protein [Bacilli bacterium]